MRLRARARRDGEAARAAELAKRARQSKAGPALAPVALDIGGRMREGTAALVRSYARAADLRGTL
eukprot:5128452-Alexandrium_andersonii.AAC.1